MPCLGCEGLSSAVLYRQYCTVQSQHLFHQCFRINFDSCNGILGNEFALVINKADTDQEHTTDSEDKISGTYIRLLDTCPTAVMTFDHRETGNIEHMKLPTSVTHSEEYVKRLLRKSSRNPFRVKLSLLKSVKS